MTCDFRLPYTPLGRDRKRLAIPQLVLADAKKVLRKFSGRRNNVKEDVGALVPRTPRCRSRSHRDRSVRNGTILWASHILRRQTNQNDVQAIAADV